MHQTNKKTWLRRIKHWKEVHPLISRNYDFESQVLSTRKYFNRQKNPNAFFTTDVGQHQMWAA
jgi:acetolactate synthase-1/2/3 large subunit